MFFSCAAPPVGQEQSSVFRVAENRGDSTIAVFRSDGTQALLVQHAQGGVRPYIHPILAPDGKGVLTEFSPDHHKHQTGLYWGLKELNGRDYFMNWKGDYWRRVSAEILDDAGPRVSWRTRYELLDGKGAAILTESQTWSFREANGKYFMDLEWVAEAKTDVTVGRFYVGGLFLRMPWHRGIDGEVVNAAGQRNGAAEGQRAVWNDIGITVPGRDDRAHIAIFDHPDNKGFPTPWRVDNELGVGPSRQILGDWNIPRGGKEIIRYRLVVYTGTFHEGDLHTSWKEFACEPVTKLPANLR